MAEELEPAAIEVLDLELDTGNLRHLERHGLDSDLVNAIRDDRPVYLSNRPGRSGSHMMVGEDTGGRLWTVVLTETEVAGTWRPITGWPSVNKEARRWRDA